MEVAPQLDPHGNRQSFDLSLFQTPSSGVPDFAPWVTDSESVIVETQPIQMKTGFYIHAWNNHSPSCMVPPVWNILASCEQQYLDLAPYDLDGDIVRCRWADLSEVGLAHYRPGMFSRPFLLVHPFCVIRPRFIDLNGPERVYMVAR